MFPAAKSTGESKNQFEGEINLAGGSVDFVSSIFGGDINISGGIVHSELDADNSATANITGGRIARVDAGSGTTFVGGEFFRNGNPLESLNAVSLPSRFSFRSSDVITGTLSDGSTFVLSSHEDSLSNVTFQEVELPAIDLTPVVVDADFAGEVNGLRAGQTITLRSGGRLGDVISAVDSTLIVEGGTIGHDLTIAGGTAHISGDATVESDFRVVNGGDVQISGGMIGPDFSVDGTSQVTISGGTFGQQFTSGFESEVSITGGEFNYNGETVSNLDGLTVSRIEDVLTGTLQDGSTFVFARRSGDSLQNINLRTVPLPEIGTLPIVIDQVDDVVPKGLRDGQSMTVRSNGTVRGNFSVVGAELTVEHGTVTQRLELSRASVNVMGGTLGTPEESSVSSVLFGLAIPVRDNSVLNVIDGEVGLFEISSGSVANISGGVVNNFSVENGVSSIF